MAGAEASEADKEHGGILQHVSGTRKLHKLRQKRPLARQGGICARLA
jgi:hypothetical protein